MRQLTASELKHVSAAGVWSINVVKQNQGNGSVNVASFNNLGLNIAGIQFQNSGQIA